MDTKFMKAAIKQAKKAASLGEVPIGAVLVKDGKIVARGYNQREKQMRCDAHAEMLALQKACKKENNWRLSDYTLYVTLEPCPMCTGALLNAHVPRVVFGAKNPQSGACGTHLNLCEMNLLNHKVEVHSGVLEQECAALMQDFFKKIRERSKKNV